MLRKHVIEREFPGIGNEPPENFCGIAQTSRNVLASLAPRVQWLETSVASDKVQCVFLAESRDVIEEHAHLTGSMIDPTYAPAWQRMRRPPDAHGRTTR